MHVLIIPSERYIPKDNHLHGIFQQHQAHALARAGYQIGVISPFLRSFMQIRERLLDWSNGLRVENEQDVAIFRYFGWQLPYVRRIKRLRWIKVGKSLFREYVKRNGRPDAIHAHNALWAGVLALEIKREWDIPFLITEHSSAFAQNLVNPFELALSEQVYRGATSRLVVSPSLGNDLEHLFGDAILPWKWVPNILSVEFEQEITTLPEVRRDDNSFCFLSIGSLDPNKAHADLLQAFASRCKQNINIQLRIGGDGPLKEDLVLLSHKLQINRQVVFLGRLNHSQVREEMQKCDVFVLPSHYETFGVVLIEALACGKPIVANKCGGPDWIVNSENGILVPIGDIDTLGQAMIEIQNRFSQFDSHQIRWECITKFGEQAVIDQLIKIYSDILSGSLDVKSTSALKELIS